MYSEERGYGFITHTSAKPPREVHPDRITAEENGVTVSEPAFYAAEGNEEDDYNHYGMAFRIKALPGAYRIDVKLTCDASEAIVSVSAMHGKRLLSPGFWDAPMSIPIQTTATGEGGSWSFAYANGQSFMDIEIEPKRVNESVGVQEIVLTPIAPKHRPESVKPAIFLLGDSTVKSYIFEEAPMSGWGQVIGNHFDRERVDVHNYSMGGRSFKNAYFEGRLNDILTIGHVGDFLLIQFGHNDEMEDEHSRFGRGSTEAMYEQYIKEVYIPAIRARGMIPVFITAMSRVDGDAGPEERYENSFQNRRFPDIMRRVGKQLAITVIDLNAQSLDYYNEIGYKATTAIVMSIEAGETPGKTNDGSYANGHPANKMDGTHYKEALAKPFARIIVSSFLKQGAGGDPVAAAIADFLKPEVRHAANTGDWSVVFPEMAKDTTLGDGAYYRNQIEKLLQLGVMSKDAEGYFHPDAPITVKEYVAAISSMMKVKPSVFEEYEDGVLTREVLAAILADAYHAAFTGKPPYMTDYNGVTVVPGDPGYDPNLDSGARGAMYYPLVSYAQLTDTRKIAPHLLPKAQQAYELGLIRSEKGIRRGKMMNGNELEPAQPLTRAKAAKSLYYMWVLQQPVKLRNDGGR